jgi:hypothetical protein
VSFGDIAALNGIGGSAFSWAICSKFDNLSGRKMLLTKSAGRGGAIGTAGWLIATNATKWEFNLDSFEASVAGRIKVTATTAGPSTTAYEVFGGSYDGSGDAAGVAMYEDGASIAVTVSRDDFAGGDTDANSEPVRLGTSGAALASGEELDARVGWAAVWVGTELTAVQHAKIAEWDYDLSGGIADDGDGVTVPVPTFYAPIIYTDTTTEVADLSPGGNDGTPSGVVAGDFELAGVQ